MLHAEAFSSALASRHSEPELAEYRHSEPELAGYRHSEPEIAGQITIIFGTPASTVAPYSKGSWVEKPVLCDWGESGNATTFCCSW
jgi:hypothetical protein